MRILFQEGGRRLGPVGKPALTDDRTRTMAGGEFGVTRINVNGEDIEGLVLSVAPTGRVRGRAVLDGQSYPASGGTRIEIAAVPMGAETSAAGPSAEMLTGRGEFDIAGLSGRFLLRVTGLPAGLSLDRVDLSGEDVTDAGVEIRAGEIVSEVEVVLTSQGTSLGGKVVGDGTGDVDGCTVVLFSTDRRRWALPATRYVAGARVSVDGSFSLDGLPPGNYLATALGYVEKGQWRDAECLDGAAPDATPITLRAGARQELVLRCSGS
jgi:hypothetical protein